MRIDRDSLQDVMFGDGRRVRFTQDTPVMPDVWIVFGADPTAAVDLLMVPRRGAAPAQLASALIDAGVTFENEACSPPAEVAYDDSHVVARVAFPTLVRVVLPLSSWWYGPPGKLADLSAADIARAAAGTRTKVTDVGVWFLRLLGTIAWARENADGDLPIEVDDYKALLADLLAGCPATRPKDVPLWSVNRNRDAEIATWTSSKTIKADAARNIFNVGCGHLRWAVLDTGIDAAHPAFRLRDAKGKPRKPTKSKSAAQLSRVTATYDFTRIRALLTGDLGDLPEELGASNPGAELRRRLRSGQAVDWELLEGMLRVDHADYAAPEHPHGTHVAGILAGDWRVGDPDYEADPEEDLVGICPDIELFDLRVLGSDGTGDEFSILAAMQFIRYLNARSRAPFIHGANLSLSIPHDVSNFACGRTPVCEEAERLWASGVVVVAAAGNRGYARYLTPRGEAEAYQNISITDPGNAERVITVGATHRRRPHTYGVSYFSSRGPTGDGRLKPDLVAPGEKITGPTPGGSYDHMDGTSMAAPHVSGAAAMVMSRHAEFIGEPDRIKKVLCETCTDLGRERYFQGAGLIDVCRALQSL